MSGEGPPQAANCAPSGGSEHRRHASVGAPLLRRFAALIYEGLLVVAIVFATNFAMLPFVTPHRGTSEALIVPALPERLALFWIVFAVLAAYFVWCWSNGRRTLAMKTWRLVLTHDGGNLAPKTALLRYLACWIGPALAIALYFVLARYGLGAHAVWLVAFNFLWGFVDRDRQFLHDRIAGTRLNLA